jgi:hypothetical protein
MKGMARGFESKSVESQQADLERKEESSAPVSPQEAARLARRRTLELARARAVQDRATANRPAHRAMLDAAIRSIDEQIARESGS